LEIHRLRATQVTGTSVDLDCEYREIDESNDYKFRGIVSLRTVVDIYEWPLQSPTQLLEVAAHMSYRGLHAVIMGLEV
jgi:hypothetical protein